jgi:hypothetical protein
MNGRATARVTPSRTAAAPRGGVGTAPRTTPRTTARATPRTAPRAAPRPELRLVPTTPVIRPRRAASALRNRRAPFVLLVVALLVATTLGLLILNTAIAVDSLKATQLRADNAERAQEVQRLEQQVVSASTPAEIARAAAAAGLIPAGPAAYVVIQPDGTSVVRGAPAPAGSPGDVEGGD